MLHASPRWPIAAVLLLVAAPTHAAPSPADCVAEATESFQRREFKAAAEAAERCHAASKQPRALFLVAMARLALNQDALALLALERYLAVDLTAEPPRSQETARLKRDEARARTVALTLKISPPPVGPDEATITATRDGAPEIVVPPIERGAAGPLLRLDAGAWTVTVTRPGFEPLQTAVTVASEERERTLELTLRPEQVQVAAPVMATAPTPPPAPEFPRAPWLAASAGTGAALLVGGLVAFPLGVVRTGRQLDTPASACAPGPALDGCRGEVAKHTTVRGLGAGLLGAGFGALASGLTALLPRPRARRVAWAVEVGVGGALAAAGATLLGLGLREFNAVNTGNADPTLYWGARYQSEALRITGQYTAGAGLLGAGVGLAVGATIGLVVQSRVGRRIRSARLRLEPAAGLRLRF